MVERLVIEENLHKLGTIMGKLQQALNLHKTALIKYKVRGVMKTLPQEDIDGFIEDYKDLKKQIIADFKDIL